MSKRVQITLTDDEYAAVLELSELRGESMSMIIANELAAIAPAWRQEIRAWKITRRKEDAVANEIHKLKRAVQHELQDELKLDD
jgi:hypothetical protein